MSLCDRGSVTDALRWEYEIDNLVFIAHYIREEMMYYEEKYQWVFL